MGILPVKTNPHHCHLARAKNHIFFQFSLRRRRHIAASPVRAWNPKNKPPKPSSPPSGRHTTPKAVLYTHQGPKVNAKSGISDAHRSNLSRLLHCKFYILNSESPNRPSSIENRQSYRGRRLTELNTFICWNFHMNHWVPFQYHSFHYHFLWVQKSFE